MCGSVDVRKCGCAEVWMCGCVDVWMCGCVDVSMIMPTDAFFVFCLTMGPESHELLPELWGQILLSDNLSTNDVGNARVAAYTLRRAAGGGTPDGIVRFATARGAAMEDMLIGASKTGFNDVLDAIFEMDHALRADCNDGAALVAASGSGHTSTVAKLLGYSHAPAPSPSALAAAAGGGHLDIMDMFRTTDMRPDPCPALEAAAREGRIEAMLFLMHGWPAEEWDEGWRDALQVAAGNDDARGFVHLMCCRPAFEPYSLEVELTEAAARGSVGVIRYILSNPVDVWRGEDFDFSEVLRAAVSSGNIEAIRCLLEHNHLREVARGQDYNDAMCEAASRGNAEASRFLVNWLSEHQKGVEGLVDKETLMAAARGGHVPAVRFVLEWPTGPRADADDGRALAEAASHGHVDVMRLLLECETWGIRADCRSGEALVRAAGYGSLEGVHLLLGWPSGPSADSQNGEALVRAASNGHLEVVHLLIGWPSGPSADCQNGRALERASERSYGRVARFLLNLPHVRWPQDVRARASERIEENGGEDMFAANAWNS